MQQNPPKIYLINEDSTEQLLVANKFRFEYETGAKVTVEINKREMNEIILRGYYGDKEYGRPEKGTTLNIRPGGCNLISITHELNDITSSVE